MKFIRTFLLAAAAGVSYLGYVECRESLERPAPSTLKPSALGELKDPDPVWVRLEGRFVPLYPLVRAAEPGGDKATWLPIATPEEPGKVVCVLELECAEGADGVSPREHRELYQPIGGLARLPAGKDDKAKMETLAASSRVSLAPRCRVLAVGSKPWAVPLSLGLLAFGVLGALAAVLCPGQKWTASRRSGTSPGRQDFLVSPDVDRYIARVIAQAVALSPQLPRSPSGRRSAPLPPEVKDEVAQMVAEAWDRAA
jgi:hypothetical protein